MSPAAGIAKNIVLLLVMMFLLRSAPLWNIKWSNVLISTVLVAGLVIPFVAAPIAPYKSIQPAVVAHTIDLTPVYDPQNLIVPTLDLKTGKHILAFLSPSCPHCRMAAYKMHLLKQQHPEFPFFLIIGGTRSDLTGFYAETKSADLPSSRLESRSFMQYTGGTFPMILFINNGVLVSRMEYNELDPAAITQWLNQRP